jgi:chloramphenicol-sensitive protein RarD
MTHSPQTLDRTGLLIGVCLYTLWGFYPLYYHFIEFVPTWEIIAHRIIWSMILLLIILFAMRQQAQLFAIFQSPKLMARLALSAMFISYNWVLYVWSVTTGHVLAAGLGYYLTPLVNVAAGVLVLGERLRTLQMLAVAIAAAGVAYATKDALGQIWISVTLALSFSLYSLVRKVTPVAPLAGLTYETLILTPFVLALMGWMLGHGHVLVFGHTTPLVNWLLVLISFTTAIPFLMLNAAAKRLPLSILGMLQYIGPSIIFVLGLYYFHEKLHLPMLIAFISILIALTIFSVDMVRTMLQSKVQ